MNELYRLRIYPKFMMYSVDKCQDGLVTTSLMSLSINNEIYFGYFCTNPQKNTLLKSVKHMRNKTNIKADVIILGCSLPGFVTAHKLKKNFGDSMDIVLLDIADVSKVISKCGVAFKEDVRKPAENEEMDNIDVLDVLDIEDSKDPEDKPDLETLTRHYLVTYTTEFQIPIPEAIIDPVKVESKLKKMFQFPDGKVVECTKHFSDFNYLSWIEKFELQQYQTFLDKSMLNLFRTNKLDDPTEKHRLLYYDQTSMETSICETLLFATSRAIMRTAVELACGAPAHMVSLLFYLHQCYRTSGVKNHIDGRNMRLREKLFGHCRIRLSAQLKRSVADITLRAKPIKNIRTFIDADVKQVIIETQFGDTNYICNLLAMAVNPSQLEDIEVDNKLLSEKEATIVTSFTPGTAKKFVIQYKENFWERQGYSGDILSIRGPIIWAIAKPKFSSTGSEQKYFGLSGYLMVKDDGSDSKDAVVEQLTNLFGVEANSPVFYKESSIADIFVPKQGDYVGLRVLTSEVVPRGLEWSAIDVYADGDVSAALQAGHLAYLHLVSCFRPQAQSFEDIAGNSLPTVLGEFPMHWWLSRINLVNSLKFTVCTTAAFVGYKLIRSFMK